MPERRWAIALICSLAINSAALAAVVYGVSPAAGREPAYMEVSMAELFSPVADTPRPQAAASGGTPSVGHANRRSSADNASSTVPSGADISTGAIGDGGAVAAPAIAGGGANTAGKPVGGISRGPRVVYGPAPEYPEKARQSGWQGTVRLKILINTSGAVEDITLAAGSGNEDLDRAAATTVRNWRFSPAVREGVPISAWVTLPVVFTLK